MTRRILIFALFVVVLIPQSLLAESTSGKDARYRTWIEEMKQSARGPFSQIRWFCEDGSVLPPKPYACGKRGGGVQHGEWSDRTVQLRSEGYLIANVLADMDFEALKLKPGQADALNQILLEQYLIAVDDGWIMRKAQFYRGALQSEDESAGARKLLAGLTGSTDWLTRGYAPLRVTARLLPHGKVTASVTKIRQDSADLSSKDKGFMTLRNKIHGKPELADAAIVREYAAGIDNSKLAEEYEQLAVLIEQVYQRPSPAGALHEFAGQIKNDTGFANALSASAKALAERSDPASQFALSADLLELLRSNLANLETASLRLEAIDLSLELEVDHFVAATSLRDRIDTATRKERLIWLQQSAQAIYGAGLISDRELSALNSEFDRLKASEVRLADYKAVLDYFSRVPGWATNNLRFHFLVSMQKLTVIESRSALFVQDQLRGSPLFFYSELLDSLLQDANQLAGVRNELFGQDVGGGLHSLNPGLARGVFRTGMDEGEADHFKSDGIYLLPETISELPPVAGILTAGAGNPLSHVQLLARNLGIPNVAVDERLVPLLKDHDGEQVILAVSPHGSVRLAKDTGKLDKVFGQKEKVQNVVIRPDLEKLDLTVVDFIPLDELRASDSGRTVGPKAAKLGELYHQYPASVANGLTIPFGIFRQLLDQPLEEGGSQSVFDWMLGQYDDIAGMPEGSTEREKKTEAFRQRLQEWIIHADPGDDFRKRLRQAMDQVFGKDGTYGVFVRSDTNVEDLPGFTGAGLNLTVANVVGFEDVLATIPRVWASPFSSRAYSWRQSLMEQPEHVYTSILLLRSVPADKSGVMVTRDIDTGREGWLSVAINEGVGGAVDGQAAESVRINMETGKIRLLSQATAPVRRIPDPAGGVAKLPVSGSDTVLEPNEAAQLIELAAGLPENFPSIVDAQGKPAPADIEFGFLDSELKLFQIRPFLENDRTRSSQYLISLDEGMRERQTKMVLMDQVPGE